MFLITHHSSLTLLSSAGMDVTANQEEISDHETFQLEHEPSSGKWYLRTMQDRYFTLAAGGGIQAAEKKKTDQALFDLLWQEDGSVSFKAANGNFTNLNSPESIQQSGSIVYICR